MSGVAKLPRRTAARKTKATYLRARKSEQKEERRQLIIEVTRALYEQAPFSEITMSEVAKSSGLAKGTVYGYFLTKEELFLAIADEEVAIWIELLITRLSALNEPTIEAVVDALCSSMAERPLLPRVLTILHPTLEHNVELESMLHFKTNLVHRGGMAATKLEEVLPFLPSGVGVQFFAILWALIIGLRDMTSPSRVARCALNHPTLAPLRLDFDPALRSVVELVLAGLKAKYGGPSRLANRAPGPRAGLQR